MPRLVTSLLALAVVVGSGAVARCNNSSSDSVNVRWIGDTPTYQAGTSFGISWPRGKYHPEKTQFSASDSGNEQIDLQTWVTAYWPDGSIKWSGHAIPELESISDEYTVKASSTSAPFSNSTKSGNITVTDSSGEITVNTGKLEVAFPKEGNTIISSIKTASGKTIGQNGKLVLHSQSAVEDDIGSKPETSIEYFNFESQIENVTISDDSSVRALITVNGKHQTTTGDHESWLPFVLRFYLYGNSDAVRLVHTLVYDRNSSQDFITGVGIKFEVPLTDEELYNRHVRLAGVDGGILHEAVQGITGLRRDPGSSVRTAQFEGEETPDVSTWDTRVSTRLKWIPTWNDFTLTQLSPDGFTLQKRTKAGQSWLNIPGGTRSGGLAYLGGATQGGLAVGLRDFWKRYPTSLDIRNAATDTGEITLWLYSPSAPPQDLRPYHDGLGEEGYADELDALEITYEDYQPGFNTPYGIARTSEVYLFGFETTPSGDDLAALTDYINKPPALFADSEHIRKSKAFGSYWAAPDNSSEAAATIETHLDFLVTYYQGQISDRRWYGFWDYGDIMHTYDTDRHTWRYDIGGYAWDNSELSPNLFFWTYFLRTGREDVYRFAEAHARHTGEVDMYHIGPWKGIGTRHGVQHWGDSAKQVRIAQPQYRKVFYYISGGDERVGEVMHECIDADQTYIVLDPQRKVRTDGYVPSETAVSIELGVDWSGLAAGWLIEWERRGPRWEEAKSKLTNTLTGIVKLKNGFVTGDAMYNPQNGTLSAPFGDPENKGVVSVSHLSAVFGQNEVIAELFEHYGDDLPAGFEEAWLDYCYYYGASSAEQAARYGESFGSLSLLQGHSRLTAFAANKLGNSTLAERAWSEFFTGDGLSADAAWSSEPISGSQVLIPVTEAAWLSTNDAALYGLAAIEDLAMVRDALDSYSS